MPSRRGIITMWIRYAFQIWEIVLLTDIYLIRHGQPIHNPSIPYHTLPGPPLSDLGRAEAKAAAAFLTITNIQHLFVSPFDRTAQTAEAIIDQLGIDATFTQAVAEHAMGESSSDVRTRIGALLDTLDQGVLQRIGIVSHGSPIKEALMHLSKGQIDLSKHVYPGNNPAPTCGIWHIRYVNNKRSFTLVFKPLTPAAKI